MSAPALAKRSSRIFGQFFARELHLQSRLISLVTASFSFWFNLFANHLKEEEGVTSL
jgi:hypothetical protein|tara:strand:+ start:802 stop:972 length:171 start_codon:yes stop_codon:yes gene_type:complete